VVCQLAEVFFGVVRVEVLEGQADPCVQRYPATRVQLLVQGLADESVREPQAAGNP
jgi:hypothetical protein